jgi:SHS2 domain-containing protein
MAYRQIHHTADIGLEITADTAAALFSEAATGMFSIIVSGEVAGAVDTRDIRVQADDWEGLLVAWLRELLYLWHDKGLRFCRVLNWEATDHDIAATVSVDRFDAGIHIVDSEIKAVTYHQITVKTDGTRWQGRVIFDI